MSYTEVTAGDLIKASIANANWRHFGRADLSSFYPMDVSGDYVSQDLGEVGKEWANGFFTGDLTVDGDVLSGGGIATGGNEAIKFDIINGTQSVGGSTTSNINVAHGKGENIRGVMVCGFDSSSTTVDYHVAINYSNETNVNIAITNSSISTSTISYSIIVGYV